ncbi:hypothetical protein [Shewanella salipaludis]|uniref:Uncharacterized protein n=1 Tax=Shewanella salipaludis TaxID=2723052 RepID=A0A972G678_9GAMM|nr:hypothetical protein [Shewanella salipaludis]NMH65205.1 hypothetical protein [Shewanella salipaludis]
MKLITAMSRQTKATAASEVNQKLVNFLVNIRVSFIYPLTRRIIIVMILVEMSQHRAPKAPAIIQQERLKGNRQEGGSRPGGKDAAREAGSAYGPGCPG